MKSLKDALAALDQDESIEIEEVSPVYETEPVDVGGGSFLNAVAVVGTSLSPEDLLYNLRRIETSLGRVREKGKTLPRVIDLDILLYGDGAFKKQNLTIPHPRMTSRLFVMAPLADLAPDLVVPGENRTARRIAEVLERRYPGQRVIKLTVEAHPRE